MQNATWTVTATHATVSQSITRHIERIGHQGYMDNFFSSPNLFGDLHNNNQLLWNCQMQL